MIGNSFDILVIAGFLVVLLGIGFWHGRGKRDSAAHYFVAEGTLPWWAMGAAFVATGMNTEQLVGQNGMGYQIGLTMLNWYVIAVFVYTPLIFVFFPVYLRNGIRTMPEYLGRRFDRKSENVFAVLLLASYTLLNLAVVFYGGAKILEVVFGLPLWTGLILLAAVAGLYTMYGGMSSMVYAALFQFLFIFVSGMALFVMAYLRLPNGWQDVIDAAPGGYHLIQPMDYDVIPWHAIPLTILGLHLFYSCINQALVQRGFGGKTEWDVRMAIVMAGFFVVLRPFVEIFPGMIARALAVFDPAFRLGDQPVDNVFPMLIRNLVPAGFRGLIVVGILSSVMSTIAAFLNSISTLFTYDVYKKWFRQDATDRELIRVGTLATFVLMVFAVLYSPVIGHFGGIFNYFQQMASYLAVPIATVFLFGMFWKRATPAAALTVIVAGIPIGIAIHLGIIPALLTGDVVARYSLDNFFVVSGITQAVLAVVMIAVSLCTTPRPVHEIAALLWTKDKLFLPPDEPKRPLLKSVGFWWSLFALMYAGLYVYLW